MASAVLGATSVARQLDHSESATSFFFTGVGVCSPQDDLGFLRQHSKTYADFWFPILDGEADSTRREVLGQIALQTSLADLWRQWGVAPTSSAGHSLGELPAAYAAGMYSLEEVAALGRWIADAMVARRGWLAAGVGLTQTPGSHLASTNFVDADSGKLHSSFCGEEGAWDAFAAANPTAKRLHVGHCWHHPDTKASSTVPVAQSAPAKIPFWASSHACFVERIDATFWEDWLRKPVDVSQFAKTYSTANIIIEIAAHPTASSFVPAGATLVSSMGRGMAGLPYILQQRARVPAASAAIDTEVRGVFAAFDAAQPWLSQGMNSVALTQVATRLSHFFPGLVPADLYSHETLEKLIGCYGQQAAVAGLPFAPPAPVQDTHVLVAGIGCWLPGGLSSPASALDFFVQRGDAITVKKDFSPHGCGYVADFPFEFAKFGLKPNEARCMDPQQALALLVADMAVADAGLGEAKLAGPRTGVYMGAWNQDFQGERSSAYDVVGSNPSLIPARISSHFDLRGPSVLVNTACASSLQCMVQALGDLRLGKVDVALVGGVNLIQDPEFTERMKRGGFLGDSCRCKTFDASADGYVRSEGAVVAVLARADAPALRGRSPDAFYAEVLGGASNHNGSSPLITVPSAEAQAELIVTACHDAGIAPGELDVVECHGTGTRIGDPIEVSGIAQALQKGPGTNPDKPLYLTSAKANVGHLESAAGMVGVLRAVLSVNAETVFGNPLLETLNPGLKLPERCRVATDTIPGVKPGAVGVSSFGFGGSNAHVVIGRPGKKAPCASSLELPTEEGPDVMIVRKIPPAAETELPSSSDAASTSSDSGDDSPPAAGDVLAKLVALMAQMGHKGASSELPLLELGMDSLAITDFSMQIGKVFPAVDLGSLHLAEWSLAALAATIVKSGAGSAPSRAAVPLPAAKPVRASLDSFDYYLTRPLRDEGKPSILTSHVGSLPSSFGSTSFEHVFQQIDIGMDMINDGEVNRSSYVDEALSRLSGFEAPSKQLDQVPNESSQGVMPHDVAECPDCARRFTGRSSLITLNKRFPALNPICVGPVAYTDEKMTEIRQSLDEFEAALQQNGTEPSAAFYSVPSPGTLALFFKNTFYASEDEYLEALAKALAVEYREIVRRGFTLHVDCPDLAMGRHTQFQKLSNREFQRSCGNNIRHLNSALEGLPKEKIRVHVCYGNYAFAHHRDVSLSLIVDQLNNIHCKTLLIENASARHQHEIEVMGRLRSHVVCLGVLDTKSPVVESPQLVAQRLVQLAQHVGPQRVMAGSDCGFATTSESGGANSEIVFMKFRSMVQGARIATSTLFPTVPLFQPRATARLYWFGEKPASALPPCEVRYVPDSLELAQVARHMRSYTDIPVFFVVQAASPSMATETRITQLRSMLEGTAAYPKDVIAWESADRLQEAMRRAVTFDRARLCLSERLLSGTPGATRDCVRPAAEYDVVVVGAGVTGLHVAHELRSAGVRVCVLEKSSRVGGIWGTFANDRSQVNSSEAAYRLLDKKDTNKDHSNTREILTDCLTIASGLGEGLFLQAEVENVAVNEGAELRYTTQLAGGLPPVRSRGIVMAINDRVGVPRAVRWPGQERFKGEVRDGFSNDAANLNWTGKKVVIVGMGAFATENLRTAMECGAKEVTIVARRHGTVCPKYIDYINFVNKDASTVSQCAESSLGHDSVTNTKNMITWRDLYERTGAKMPECWMKEIKHYGHTISVSDIWFIGHHLRILDSIADDIDHFEEDGIVLKENGLLEADIVIRCTGFERNAQLIPKLTPYTQVNSCNYLDKNCMYLADALIDDNVFNSVFGSSVMEIARIFCSVYLYFWKNPTEYDLICPRLALTPVEQRKWSDYIGGLDLLCAEFPGVREQALQRVNKRCSDFLRAHTVDEYLRENRREWQELHKILGIWSDETAYLPYPQWSSAVATPSPESA